MPVENGATVAMDANQLMNHVAIGGLSTGTWLADPVKVERVKTLRELAFGNCRLLYGSERGKFFDIVLAEDEDNGLFCAIVVCSQEGASKILRKQVADDPLKAVRAVVDRLQKDTSLLFHKFDVGSQLKGQQGYTEKETGKFALAELAEDCRIEGPDDDTQGLISRFTDAPGGVPRGPRADRGMLKRARVDRFDGRFGEGCANEGRINNGRFNDGRLNDGCTTPLDYGDL